MSTGTAVSRTGVGTIPIPLAAAGKITIAKFDLANYASVQFANATTGNVGVWIPNGGKLFAGADTKGDIFLLVPASGTSRSLAVSNPQRGVYRYSVYCEAIGDFAEGGSAPEIHCS